MEEEKTFGKETCNRFVAFLDIMGFKDLVLKTSHKGVYNKLAPFSDELKVIDGLGTVNIGRQSMINTRLMIFSDSIILISKNDNMRSAGHIILSVGLILFHAMSKKIPIKGAIAYGKQTADFKKSLFFGKPLIDAFELQNELKLYGVVLHDSVEKRMTEIDEIEYLKNHDFLKWYSIPMKSDRINHYLVNWTDKLIIEKNDPSKMVSSLYNSVSGKPRKYVDNTLEFLDWLKKEEAKRKKKKKS
jgi:hypothetical protein